ncbi:MAG: exodeoxyribonuclease VII large subunit [Anaerolineales bacterium]|nr:exodeoxyribonuclease VII large subunit [Anaerolineales bacterium]
MQQLPLFHSNCLTVTEINRLARITLESDPVLQDVWIGGEVSGLSRPASRHLYFTLKDAGAAIRCVMWRDAAVRIAIPREGEAVEAHGRISLYEAGGQYQLYADYLQPAGQGELYTEFLRLKAKLETEGLFDPARKCELPRWPRRIAVVTSPIGAAWQDVQTVLARRFPIVEVLFAPTAVQGEDAPKRICAALRKADQAKADVVLLVRGGGSIEDLWAFNDELVVRTVAAMQTPVVTGVGHESDFTLADFAADLRAPTPSAAAEMASPDREELRQHITVHRRRLDLRVESVLRESRDRLRSATIRLQAVSPLHRLQNIRQQTDDVSRRAEASIRGRLCLYRSRLEGLARVLAGMGPARVLERGYALIWSEADGRLVRSVRQAPAGARLRVQVADGKLAARSEGAE